MTVLATNKDMANMTIPNMMRAVFADGRDKPFVLRETETPRPGPNQVLVRMQATGVCPTDMSIATGSWLMKRPMYPYVPGHEGCGIVAAVGANVRSTREGERVGVFWLNSTCGACPYCSGGLENLCVGQESTGYTSNGTHAEYCVVDSDYVVPLPEGEFSALTPILCAGVTSYKAVKELGAKQGDPIVVIGVGATGHLAIQYAAARGLKVIAVDVDERKLELAAKLGADLCVNAADFPVNKVLKETGGAFGVIVTAATGKAFEQGMRMLRRGGVCVLVGVSEEPLSISAFQTVINELRIQGTVSGTRRDVIEALALVAEGRVRTVVETRPLEDINVAVEAVLGKNVLGRMVLTI